MKKYILLLLLLSTKPIYSQELDPAYLASLPDEVREDVLQQIDNKKELDEVVYRRPSTMIRKNYCDENKFTKYDNYKNSNFNNLNNEFDPSYINDDTCIEKSDRFGTNFFDMMQTSFMPVNEPNVDSSYILDFGDTLELLLTGQKNSEEVIPINRDGSINVPEIGKIFVAGVSLNDANEIIQEKFSNAFVDIKAFLTLTDIRDIQVLITGNAYNPGIYTLNGNSNLLHALSMAGGIDEKGSYRKIELIRNDETIMTMDLYDIFIFGMSDYGQRLRSGDTILVKPVLDLVTISGAINRPGVYELKPEESFLDLFRYGNGFTDSANKEAIRIERIEKEEVNFIAVENVDDLGNIKPLSSDRLYIRSYVRKKAKILGAVNSPGTYALSNGETLSSLIKKAEGYKDNAYPFGGILNNKTALELNKKAAESLYTTFVQKLVTKGDPLFASESLPFALRELKKYDISGRIMAEFDLSILSADPNLDTVLNDGDEIIIPIKTQQVYIFGEVNNDGAIRYKPSQTINSYLSRAGGITENADRAYIYVVHPNGEVNRVRNQKLNFLSNRSNDILIYPGSVIYVPRKVNSQEAAIVASIWAPIVSAMATSITALSVLNNN
jgi:protein involved in polysaccharide export with SLBB domain